MGSCKRGPDTNRSIAVQTRSLHQRLLQSLKLGITRPHERQGRKWQCTDFQIQKQVVHLALLGSVSRAMLQDPLLKGSIPDLLEALLWILKCKNEVILSKAADAMEKLVSALPSPSSILEAQVLDLVSPLSSLLSYHQTEVATSCAKALKLALSHTTITNEKEVWDVLESTDCVRHAVNNIRSFSRATKPIEYFQQMVALLSKVILRWPSSRYSAWRDALLLQTLYDALANSDSDPFVKVEVLRLLSTIALCGSGATKLLENGEALLEAMVQCMDSSQPRSIRMEGFKLAQCLAISEQRFFKMMSFCCESFIQAIVSGMRRQKTKSKKVDNEQISLVLEACSLALITRWGGKHHKIFWKHGIDEVLMDLLLENSDKQLHENSVSLREQISIARASLDSNYSSVIRDHIWHILGCLVIHCGEDFYTKRHQNTLSIDMLITCACVAFVNTIVKQICYSLQRESAIRVVLLMIYSPCTYIASNTRSVLSEVLKPKGGDILKQLMSRLEAIPSEKNFDRVQIMVYMMALTCYIGLPEFRMRILEYSGVKILLTLVRWCLSNGVNVESLGSMWFSHNSFLDRACCLSSEDWEGKDIIALCSLWGLAELIKHSARIDNNLEISSCRMTYSVPELLNNLWEICINTSAPSPGVRWFATYALGSLGLYGFPSKLGNRIGDALGDKDHADTRLVLANGECLSVHGVILAVRCPSLLPHKELHLGEETFDSLLPSSTNMGGKVQKEIRLSAHVDHQALSKLLDFIYFGYLQAEEELVKKLRTLSKRCNLLPLSQMLCGKIPKWNTSFPSYDLSLALGPVGHYFSDVIVQAKENDSLGWTCDVCSGLVPHMHVHKVILASSCDYLRGLFNSGMTESRSKTIKLDISWEAMVKLVAWFYSDEVSNPTSRCIWENMSVEEKLHELQPYVELCWLAEFWCLENVQEACSSVIVSHLDSSHSSRQLSVKIMQMAASLSVENLVGVAATCAAHFFRELCDSGELEDVDEVLVARIRTASVELSRERML